MSDRAVAVHVVILHDGLIGDVVAEALDLPRLDVLAAPPVGVFGDLAIQASGERLRHFCQFA